MQTPAAPCAQRRPPWLREKDKMDARERLKLPLWLCALPSLALAVEPGLRIGFDAASVPTMYADAKGAPAGIYPAIVRTAFERMGEPVELVVEPFKRLVAEMLAGRAAAGAVVRTPERLAVADYSSDYFTEHLSLFQRADAARQVSTVDDLRGLTVGVIRGWSYGEAFDSARAQRLFSVDETDSDAKNFSKLQLGRLDAVLATELAGRLLLVDALAGQIVAAPRSLVSIGIALAIPKRLAATRLLQRFDEAVAGLRRDRLIEAIVSAELERVRRRAEGKK